MSYGLVFQPAKVDRLDFGQSSFGVCHLRHNRQLFGQSLEISSTGISILHKAVSLLFGPGYYHPAWRAKWHSAGTRSKATLCGILSLHAAMLWLCSKPKIQKNTITQNLQKKEKPTSSLLIHQERYKIQPFVSLGRTLIISQHHTLDLASQSRLFNTISKRTYTTERVAQKVKTSTAHS